MKKLIILLLYTFLSLGQEPIYTQDQVDRPAVFAEDQSDLRKFIRSNIKYPPQAQRKNTKGKVVIGFIVQKDGTLTDIMLREGIGNGCDEEAARVVGLMKAWIPAQKNGQPVSSYVEMPFTFSLESNKKCRRGLFGL